MATPAPGLDRWTAADLDHMPENGLRYEALNGQLVVNPAAPITGSSSQAWTTARPLFRRAVR